MATKATARATAGWAFPLLTSSPSAAGTSAPRTAPANWTSGLLSSWPVTHVPSREPATETRILVVAARPDETRLGEAAGVVFTIAHHRAPKVRTRGGAPDRDGILGRAASPNRHEIIEVFSTD